MPKSQKSKKPVKKVKSAAKSGSSAAPKAKLKKKEAPKGTVKAKPAPKGGLLKTASKLIAKAVKAATPAPVKAKPAPAVKAKAAVDPKAAAKAPAKADKKVDAPKVEAQTPHVKPVKAAPVAVDAKDAKLEAKAASKTDAARKKKVDDEAQALEEYERLEREILGVGGDAEDVVPTDAEGNPYCKVKECDQLAKVDRFCRFHYLLLWKKLQLRKKILADGKLEKYIEDLTSRYPDKYIEMIRRDLRTEKDFLSAIQELEIDDSGLDGDFEEENENVMEEVRGMGRSGREDDEF